MGGTQMIKVKQVLLFDYESEELTFDEALALARTRYRGDKGVQVWLGIYENGLPDVKVNGNGGKKKITIAGIKPKSEFARRNLLKAVRLREEGKVMGVRQNDTETN